MNQQTHRQALPKGYMLQEYQIDRVLGAGGFGLTYLGWDTRLDQPVAIKEYLPNDLAVREADHSVLPKSGGDEENFRWGLDRFLDEARTLVRFKHPNIVSVYRHIEAHGTAYIVMEFVEGETLGDYLKRAGRPKESYLRAVLGALLDGLSEVHRAGFMHRDIKPGNIILNAKGAPVLVDFGSARQEVGGRSRSITSVVTPGYAPIEQYSTRGNQGPWTDIYALGAVMYRAVTGAPPPDATERMLNDSIKPAVEAGRGNYSAEFLRAIDSALAVDKKDRPQDVEAWRGALADEARAERPMAVESQAKPEFKPEVSEAGASAPVGGGGGKLRRGVRITAVLALLGVVVAAAWLGLDHYQQRRVSMARAAIQAVADLDELKRQQAQAKKALAELEASNQREQAALAELRRQAEESRKAVADLDELKRQQAQAKKALAELEASNQREQAALAELRRQAEESRKAVADLEELKRQQAQAKKALAELEASNQREQAALAELRRQAEESRKAVADLEELKRQQAQAKKALAELDASKRREQAALAELRRQAEESRKAAEARYAVGSQFRDCPHCPQMVVVPAGSFMMGSPSSEQGRDDDEGPVHRVTMAQPFAVGVYEVTFAEWDACVADGGCGGYRPGDEGWGRGSRPVINVHWEDAQAYTRWLSAKTGERYRLLSEAEWEYVARAGTTTPFHTGSTISTEQANYNGNYIYGSGAQGVYREETMPVGSFPANQFGLHDAHGNVWERVQDCSNGSYAGAPNNGSAWESGDCSWRVLRGGSWYNSPGNLRSANRSWSTSGYRDDRVGFRVARTLTP